MDQFHLGRIFVPDERDKNYSFVRAFSEFPRKATTRKSRMWRAGPAKLDQGWHPSCVGMTGANWLQNLPVYERVDTQVGHNLYAECKKVDGIPNVDGTYARALMKVFQAMNKVEMYVWADNPANFKTWILERGPILVGTNWTTGMFSTLEGLVVPTGEIVGGHEYLVRGYDHTQKAYRCVNSWGKDWGVNGEFWLLEKDLYSLIFDQEGDACAAVQKPPSLLRRVVDNVTLGLDSLK